METEIENSSQVIELQKRVKVLQGKLDKQKEQTKALGENLKARQKTDVHGGAEGGTKGMCAGVKVSEGAATAAVDSKVCIITLLYKTGSTFTVKLDNVCTPSYRSSKRAVNYGNKCT